MVVWSLTAEKEPSTQGAPSGREDDGCASAQLVTLAATAPSVESSIPAS